MNYYGVVGGSCIQCADVNCMTCNTNINMCTVCSDGYTAYANGSCIASTAYCPIGCASCSSPSTCTSCLGNRLLVNGNCL